MSCIHRRILGCITVETSSEILKEIAVENCTGISRETPLGMPGEIQRKILGIRRYVPARTGRGILKEFVEKALKESQEEFQS